MSKKSVLAIIPARAGSKRLPGKNVRSLLGKPLVAWSCEAALSSRLITNVVLSTDCPELAEIGKKAGVEVPFLRPAELATDTVSSADVIVHAVEHYRQARGELHDVVVLLEPTSPLRKADDVDRALSLFLESYDNFDSLISYGKIQLEKPEYSARIDGLSVTPVLSEGMSTTHGRDSYFPYGVIYGAKTECYLKKKTFYSGRILPYIIERWQNYEVDDLCDFLAIESILTARNEGLL